MAVNKDNFHIGTKATWKRLKHGDHAFELYEQLKANPNVAVIRPPASNSVYLVDEQGEKVYRLADHWSRVGSCFWMLDKPLENWQMTRRISVIAEATFSDFVQY